jgi:uncharacterized protein (DUF2252 family)
MDSVQHLLDFNAGRDPERLRLKFAKMRASPFVFLRGSAHLFHVRVERHGPLKNAPPAWCCGDMHLENFGSYKGDNRLAYFDLNDFDEAALAPAAWDPLRLLASLALAADELALPQREVAPLSRRLVDAYAEALAGGKAYWLERETARGAVQRLLEQVTQRKRAELLARRTSGGARRRLRVDGVHALPATGAQAKAVRAFMAGFAAGQGDSRFFEVLDVARRIAGTGSLGLERFVILVRGKGGADGQYLMDLKATQGSTLARAGGCHQPGFADEAHRLVGVQRRMQAVSMAFLQPVRFGGQACVLRELQASEDRLDLAALAPQRRELADTLATMGRLMAWAQLRSSGREGSATADELMDFGRRGAAAGKWRDRLVEQAAAAADQVRQDWREFRQACDDGRVDCGPAGRAHD